MKEKLFHLVIAALIDTPNHPSVYGPRDGHVKGFIEPVGSLKAYSAICISGVTFYQSDLNM